MSGSSETLDGTTWKSLAEIAAEGAPILYGILQPGPDTPGGVPYVRPTEITEDVIDLSSIRRTTPTIAGKYKRSVLKPDDVILSIVGTIGKVAIVPSELDGGNITQSSVRVRPRSEVVLPRYVAWVLRSPVLRRQFDQHRLGTAVPRLNVAHVRALRVPVPPLPEQRRIVAEIEKQFTRLEAGVAALQRVQANLKRYRAAVLKAACEGRLVPTEAELAKNGDRKEKFETGEALLTRILVERRQNWNGRGKYKEAAAPESAKLPELAAGWTWATVEQLASPEPNSITDGPFGSNLKTEHYTDSGPRVIRLQNIGDGVYVDEEAHVSQAHFERLQKHRIFAGDVVIAGFGENPPRSCLIPETLGPAIVKADCIRFKPHSSVMPRYLNVALNSDPVRKRTKGMVHGVGRPRLNLGEIKSIVLPLPPFAEQTRIVAEVERRLSVIQELQAVASAALQRAVRLRQSILQRAFSGELTRPSKHVHLNA
ncbi:MAG: type restriction enzyme subunit [Verrucomicrobiota bacterium]|jgi:type I restriction enzyme S subunit